MGNKISNSTETIGFRNTNIDNYSSTLPGNFKISKEINQVINNLPLPDLDNQQEGGANLSEESLGLNEIFKKLENNQINENNEMSDTSHFISSEMYNFLMKGGAKKEQKEQKEQDTSMTRDSSAHDEKHDKEHDEEDDKKQDEEHDEELNYESSSAHTEEADEAKPTTGKKIKSKKQFKEISSVNTSDIRLITE